MTDAAAYLTVPEAAALLRISERKVYDLVSRKALPHRRAGARLLFERTALAEWVRASGRRANLAPVPHVLAGSHDALMDWAVRASLSNVASLCRGSRDGLDRVMRREACAALLHLPGQAAGRFNVDAVRGRFDGQDVVLVNWCWRQQGLIVASANPHGVAAMSDLLDPTRGRRLRVGRRAAGAGSRELFDRLIGTGPGARATAMDLVVDDLQSENDAAMAVRQDRIDAVFGAQSAAHSYGLGFVPVLKERVDLLVSRRSYFEPPLQALLTFCRSQPFADYAEALGGYDLSEHGKVVWNAA